MNLNDTAIISKLVRTLFPVASINNIKIKITCYRVMVNGCIWEWISVENACWVSQWFIKFWKAWHKWKAWQKLSLNSGLKNFLLNIISTKYSPNILLNQGHNIIHEHDQRLCSNNPKKEQIEVDISLKGNKLARFENS